MTLEAFEEGSRGPRGRPSRKNLDRIPETLVAAAAFHDTERILFCFGNSSFLGEYLFENGMQIDLIESNSNLCHFHIFVKNYYFPVLRAF